MTENFKDIEEKLYSSEFNKFFKKNVKESLMKLERKRRIRLLIISLIIILVAVFIYISIISFYSNEINHSFERSMWCLLSFITGISICIIGYMISSYKYEVKYNTLEKLLSFIGDFAEEKDKSDRYYVEQLELFDEFDNYYCDDRIKGKYGLLNIDIQEIALTKGSGKSKSTVFRGILIKIPYHKRIEGYTVIKRNSKKINNNINIENRDNINFEFNEYYNVYSNNQLDEKCIITDSFMEKMVRFAKHNIGANISISFEEGNLNIAIATYREWFEVPVFKSATNISNYRAIILEVITLLKIIDALKLEPNIGF